MTEDEAKTKWCPFYRSASNGGYTVDNRAPNDDYAGKGFQRFNCIASACMAWRHTYDTTDAFKAAMDDSFSAAPTGGYCGLAGKP